MTAVSTAVTSSGRSSPRFDISFIVPVFNARRTLSATFDSIREAAHGLNYEIVAVDDGSLDESRAIAAEHADVLVVRPCQGGAARARNDAIQRASGDIVCLVDSDVTINARALVGLLAHIQSGSDAAFGAYTALPPEAVRNAPTIFKNLVHHYAHTQGGIRPAQTFWSGFGMIRRDAFLSVGGFDPAVTRSADVEDIHLGYRMCEAGFKLTIDPECQVQHHKSYTFRGMVLSDFFHRAVPWTRAMLELRTYSTDLNLKQTWVYSSLSIYAAAAAAGALVVTGSPVAAAVGVASGAVWLTMNRPFLRYSSQVWGVSGAAKSAGFLALTHAHAPVGAALGVGFFLLRGPSQSIRNTAPLPTEEPRDPSAPQVTVAVTHHDEQIAALAHLPAVEPWWELLVVSPSCPADLPAGARHIPCGDLSAPNERRELALAQARGEVLALLDGGSIPDPDWLAQVRSAIDRQVLVQGGAINHDRSSVRKRAASMLWHWSWRPELPTRWMEDHPPTNCVYRTSVARSSGGFQDRGALLRRLSAYGVRPVRFEPAMRVSPSPDNCLPTLRSAAVLGRLQAAAMIRYYDNGPALRLARVGLAPVNLVADLARVVVQARREGSIDASFVMALPALTLGMAATQAGKIAGFLKPGSRGGDIVVLPQVEALVKA
jgi:cellulose synthase/poly-beta-1,6-N-acetylglucosamine synthase-like glycosyltransferase